jgi:hypothetical protein
MFFRVSSEDYGVLGVRYGSENLSIGASFVPVPGMYHSYFSCMFITCNKIDTHFNLNPYKGIGIIVI